MTHLESAPRICNLHSVVRSRKRLVWIVATLIALIASAAFVLLALAPFFRSTANFRVYAGDARVRYEPGAESAAAIVAGALPRAIAAVEGMQFRSFVKPVTIFVCASTLSFDRRGYRVAGAGGFVLGGRLFISPKPQNTAERLPRLLTHELSHLHLEQQLGMLRFARQVPGWFKEGLAVHVSGGAGAETVSETEARDALAGDRAFRPVATGSLLFPQTGEREGLKPHLFYRESALFVGFLARRDPGAFERLLRGFQDRLEFAALVQRAYGRDIDTLSAEFIAEIKAGR